MGRGELPTKEKVLLGVALVTLVPVRVVLAMTLLVLYYLICRVCTVFSVPNREDEQEDYAHVVGWRRVIIVQCGKMLSRIVLFVLGFYWIRQSSFCAHQNPTSSSNEVHFVPNMIIMFNVFLLNIMFDVLLKLF